MFSLYRTRTIKLSTWFAFCELDHSISSSNIYPGLSHCSEAVNPVSHNNANAKHPKATGCSIVCWPKQGHCRTFGLIWNDLSWVSYSETTRLCTLKWWNVTKCNLFGFCKLWRTFSFNSNFVHIWISAPLHILKCNNLCLLTLQYLLSNHFSRDLTDYITHEFFFFFK